MNVCRTALLKKMSTLMRFFFDADRLIGRLKILPRGIPKKLWETYFVISYLCRTANTHKLESVEDFLKFHNQICWFFTNLI